jgi:hypothetical protein
MGGEVPRVRNYTQRSLLSGALLIRDSDSVRVQFASFLEVDHNFFKITGNYASKCQFLKQNASAGTALRSGSMVGTEQNFNGTDTGSGAS